MSKSPTCEVFVKPFHGQEIPRSSSSSFGEQRINEITREIRTETNYGRSL